MNFDFGNNLKLLRTAKGLTQDEVAELLNISRQSVSRWENNTTYPDITFLPILASFYGISVDALLGVDNDTNERIKAEYFKARQKAHHNGDMKTAFELSQRIYTRFPNDKYILNHYMTDCYLMGFHNIDNKRRHYLEMSITVAKRFLKLTDDIEEMCRCIKNICLCYKLLDDNEKAIRWMNKLPSVWSCIENAALGVLDDKDRYDSIKHSLEATLHLIYRLIYASAENSKLSDEEKITILEKINSLFDIVFENGDFGYYNAFLCATNLKLAQTANDKETAMTYLKSAAVHAKEYDNAYNSSHTSLLFNHHPINPDEWTKADNETQMQKLQNKIKKQGISCLTEDEIDTVIAEKVD